MQVQEQPAKISKAKRDIMQKAADLFAERGFGSVGISEVGDVVGLGKGALYYHINSKEELLYSIMTDYMIQLIAAGQHILDTETDTKRRIDQLSESFMETMFQSRAAMTVCFREVHSLGSEKRESVLGLHADYQKIWEKTFSDGAKTGEYRDMSRIETKALLGMYFYSFLWVNVGGRLSSRKIGRDFSRIVQSAVMRDQPA